ncbi:MAG: high frequency lysogenization protein HflD [Gammaproteobacteria bacterium]
MNNNTEYNNKAIALAGMFQACALVKQLAWTGKCNNESLETSIYSLLQINSPSVIDVYQNIAKLSLGLRTLINFLDANNNFNNSSNGKKDMEIARYVFSLLYLENKLTKRPDLMNIIKTGINRANTQVNLFSLTHDNVMANLAGIYIDTLSTFTFRIHVTGSQCYLANHGIANKTRALLLAGVRSAVLWKQIGGSRLQLFFKKNTFLNCAKHLYNSSTIEQL